MGYTVPTTEPIALRAGDTWQWRREDLSDYPASVWTLTYYFRNAASYFNVIAAADGDSFAVSVTAAVTAAYTPGAYDWYALVTDGTERYQVDTGRAEISTDISAAAAYDGRTWARRMLDSVEAALEGRATSGELDLISATQEQRGITRDRAGLITLRSQLLREVAATDPSMYAGKSRLVVRF